jgi:hypothetical protein
MRQTRAYNELLSLLLRPEDQQKFEWVVGAMLNDGPRNTVVFRGSTGTGKSTLMMVVRKLAMSTPMDEFAPQVAFTTWNETGKIRPFLEEGTYVFVEDNETFDMSEEFIVITTTGDRVPVNKHYVLMQEIDNELPDIARGCSAVYNSLGEDFDIAHLENNS